LAFGGGDTAANYMLNIENIMVHGSRINFYSMGAIANSGILLETDHSSVACGNIRFGRVIISLANSPNNLKGVKMLGTNHRVALTKWDFLKVGGGTGTGTVGVEMESPGTGIAASGIVNHKFDYLNIENQAKCVYMIGGSTDNGIHGNEFKGFYFGADSGGTGFETDEAALNNRFEGGLFNADSTITEVGNCTTVYRDIRQWPTNRTISPYSRIGDVQLWMGNSAGGNDTAGAVRYGSVVDRASYAAAAAQFYKVISVDTVVRKIEVIRTNAPGAGEDCVYALYTVAGGASALTVTLGATDTTGDANVWLDLSEGDVVYVGCTPSAGAAVSPASWTIEAMNDF
jgi:hypothetical protein